MQGEGTSLEWGANIASDFRAFCTEEVRKRTYESAPLHQISVLDVLQTKQSLRWELQTTFMQTVVYANNSANCKQFANSLQTAPHPTRSTRRLNMERIKIPPIFLQANLGGQQHPAVIQHPQNVSAQRLSAQLLC